MCKEKTGWWAFATSGVKERTKESLSFNSGSLMEEHLDPLAATHLLQHTLRSLCIHENSQWVYAVFWRILPRNYPPPKWDVQGAYDRSRGNRRNWILVWEDGFCNFAASAVEQGDVGTSACAGSSSVYGDREFQYLRGLQPELFFKMSHEIYNYGEGLIGKVAADRSHKWVFKEPQENEMNFLSAWHNQSDSYPRTWEAQFQSGVKTIALIAVREGVVQLGAVNKVIEDLSYVALLRKKFSYLESLPGVLLPHPSSSSFPFKVDDRNTPDGWSYHAGLTSPAIFHDHMNQPMKITPSMSSLEALLSKLPSVGPAPSGSSSSFYELPQYLPLQRPLELMSEGKVAKEGIDGIDGEYGGDRGFDLGGESSSMPSYHLNITKSNNGF